MVIPTLDEEKTIEICIRKILQVFETGHLEGEIIVVDSSSDRTPDIAARLGARVVHPPRRGYGAAYLAGFEAARGDVVVIGDGDNTYDFSQIPGLLAPITAGEADFVIGSRFLGEIRPNAMTPLHRYIGNPLLTWVVNVLYHTKFSDTHSGFRAIKREALLSLDLHTPGMEFATEMLIQAHRKGLVIRDVPVTYYPRKSPSKLHSFADGWRHLRFVMLHKPFPFVVIPGLIIALTGLLLLIVFATDPRLETSHLHSFILGGFLVVGGFQVISFGILIRIYSITRGYEEPSGLTAGLLNYSRLEKLLWGGALLILAGVLVGVYILYVWIQSGFGRISEITLAVFALVAAIIGLQILFTSVFASMMLLEERGPP